MIIKVLPRKDCPARLRAAAYCRVSTREQEDSYETQLEVYKRKIEKDPFLSFAGIYSDLGKTGTCVSRRPGFQQMIRDACDHKYDLLYVKSISRFARNIGDCQKYVDLLAENHVTVVFERERLRTDSPGSGLALALIGAVSQDESHSISRNVSLSYQERYSRGVFNLGNNRILGYDTVNGRLVPNDDAWIVLFIFKLFADGSGYSAICRALTKAGAHTLRGNEFSPQAIKYILSNETYIGDKHLNKTPSLDYMTHKPDDPVKRKSIYLEDTHEAIVNRGTWDMCQERLGKKKSM